MRRLATACHALSICATAALLAGCSSGQNATSMLPASAAYGNVKLQAMSAYRASEQDLLFVGQSEHALAYIYSYPQGERREQVSRHDLGYILGGCSDTSGKVYFIEQFTSGEYIGVYRHGGTLTRFFPTDVEATTCSFDPTSGDLTVGPQIVKIYRNARGKPKYYSLPNHVLGTACTYDNDGNLFVAGYTFNDMGRHRDKSASVPALAELRKGSTSFVSIELPAIKSPKNSLGAMRWDGKYLAVTNGATTIYRLAVTGTKARVAGNVQLQGLGYASSIWVQDDKIVAGGSPNRSVLIWNYPAGGNPIKILRNVGNGAFVTVSVPGT